MSENTSVSAEQEFYDFVRGFEEFSKARKETQEYLLTIDGLIRENRLSGVLFYLPQNEHYYICIDAAGVFVGREGVLEVNLKEGQNIPRKEVQVFLSSLPAFQAHLKKEYPIIYEKLDFFIQFRRQQLQPACAV